MLKAIPTVYGGFRFRSRLEARWARFFDLLNLPWDYEVQGYDLGSAGCYLPDFVLGHDRVDAYVEIKPRPPISHEAKGKLYELAEGSGFPVLLFRGDPVAHELSVWEVGIGAYCQNAKLMDCRKCDGIAVLGNGFCLAVGCSCGDAWKLPIVTQEVEAAALATRQFRFREGNG